MSNDIEVADHLAKVLREVADAPISPPLDRTTWRAAFLAAARIVEEDAAKRASA